MEACGINTGAERVQINSAINDAFGAAKAAVLAVFRRVCQCCALSPFYSAAGASPYANCRINVMLHNANFVEMCGMEVRLSPRPLVVPSAPGLSRSHQTSRLHSTDRTGRAPQQIADECRPKIYCELLTI
jgi:hypothetical protein